MADPEEIVRIRTYLQQHRHTYHRDALRQQLLEAGHDLEAVEQAMAETYPELQIPPAPLSRNTKAVMILAIAGTVLLNGGLCLAGYRFFPSSGFITSVVGAVLSILGIAYFTHRDPVAARGMRWGCAVWALIVAGIVVFVAWSLSQG